MQPTVAQQEIYQRHGYQRQHVDAQIVRLKVELIQKRAAVDVDRKVAFGVKFEACAVQLVGCHGLERVIEERQGTKIGCIEEVAFQMGYINADQLNKIAQPLIKSGYGQYLLNLLK